MGKLYIVNDKYDYYSYLASLEVDLTKIIYDNKKLYIYTDKCNLAFPMDVSKISTIGIDFLGDEDVKSVKAKIELTNDKVYIDVQNSRTNKIFMNGDPYKRYTIWEDGEIIK